MRNRNSKEKTVAQQEIATPKSCDCLLSDDSTPAPETPVRSDDYGPPEGCGDTVARSRPKKKLLIEGTKRLTYIATLTAFALAMKFVGQTWGGYLQLFSLKLSFIYLPWILAAIMLGPIDAMIVGFVSDFLGIIILPTTGTIIPLLTLSNTLFPMIVGLAVRYLPLKNLFLKTAIGTAASILICTLGLSTLGLSLTYGTPFFVQLAARWAQPIIIALNLAIVGALLPLFDKLKLLPKN